MYVQERVRQSWLPFVNSRDGHSQWCVCTNVGVGEIFLIMERVLEENTELRGHDPWGHTL